MAYSLRCLDVGLRCCWNSKYPRVSSVTRVLGGREWGGSDWHSPCMARIILLQYCVGKYGGGAFSLATIDGQDWCGSLYPLCRLLAWPRRLVLVVLLRSPLGKTISCGTHSRRFLW